MKKKVLTFCLVSVFSLVTVNIVGYSNCTDGGPGTETCSVEWSLLSGLFSGGCKVTCQSGYYACCNKGESKCICKPNVGTSTPTPNQPEAIADSPILTRRKKTILNKGVCMLNKVCSSLNASFTVIVYRRI